jgi:hypothetical protein
MTVTISGYELHPNDLYETERWAILRLLEQFPELLAAMCWEPSAGNHRVADELPRCFTSDIVTYDRTHDLVLDFFGAEGMPGDAHNIITNPPYGLRNMIATRYARHALKVCDGWIALLLTAKFDSGKTRGDLFRDSYRFRGKIVLTDRIRWFGGEGSTDGTEDHAWYVWSPRGGMHGPPTIRYAGRLG